MLTGANFRNLVGMAVQCVNGIIYIVGVIALISYIFSMLLMLDTMMIDRKIENIGFSNKT